MHLTHATVSGSLKGAAFSEPIPTCVVYAGPNGTGKTTRLLAISAGLRGVRESMPGAASVEKGKLALQSGEYLGPDRVEATVRLDFDDGSLTRDLSVMRGRGRIQTDLVADALVGPAGIRYDLSDFERASDATRAAILRGCLSIGSWPWSQVEPWLRERAPAPALDALLKALPGATAEAWLPLALPWAAEKVSEKSEAHKLAGAAVDVARTKTTDLDAIRGRLPTLVARDAALDIEIRALTESISGASERAKRIADRDAEGKRLAEAVGRTERALAAATTAEAAARQARAAHQDRPDRTAALRAAHEATQREHEGTVEDVDCSRRLSERAGKALATAQATAETLAGLLSQADAQCRECGATDPLSIRPRLEAAVETLAAAQTTAEDAALDLRLAERAAKGAHEAERAAYQLLTKEERAVQVHRETRTRVDNNVSRAVDATGKAREAAQEAATTSQTTREGWETTEAVGMDLETSRALLATLETERTAIRGERDRLTQAQGVELELQRALARRETATTQVEQARALQSTLKDLQAEVMKSTYAPILEYASSLCPPDLQPYMVSESDWGAVRGKQIHFSALSDGERALVGAAFSAAFVRLGGARWRGLLLDRLEAIDPARVDAFLGAVSREVREGRLDNFLGALRADAPPALPDRVTVRWLGEGTHAV